MQKVKLSLALIYHKKTYLKNQVTKKKKKDAAEPFLDWFIETILLTWICKSAQHI